METLIKKVIQTVLCFVVAFTAPLSVMAEGEDGSSDGYDFSDATYWSSLCTSSGMDASTKQACQLYMQYISDQSSSLRDRIAELEAQQEEISANIQYYAAQVSEYQAQVAELNQQIADMNVQIVEKQGIIDSLEAQITTLEEQIEEKEALIDEVEEKIKARMVSQQETMHVNSYLDVLMGAKSFDDLIRISNALSDISAYDERTMDELSDLIDDLNETIAEVEEQKTQAETEKAQLDALKQSIVDQQAEVLALQYTAEYYESLFQQQAAELEAQGNLYAAEIENIQSTMREISEKLNEVAATAGWVVPVSGARISAGTWAYSSGGVHLGEDFAASVGTNVVAVGNGVIINSADGCPYGHLGDTCGYQYGGSTMGGNQVYLLTKINGGLYAVKYLHLLLGTPAAKGTIVAQGDVIGQVGSSGNSSGPHCHVEVFYLGDADNFSSYAQNWNGDLAFGCGWSTAALNRLCENGVGAPCRIKPESVFGG